MDLFLSSGFGPRAEGLLARNHIVGLSMAIVQNETIEARAFGMASLHPPKNCTADTLFDIASSSKSFTAASVGMIVHDSVNYPDIEWDTPLYEIMPDDFVMSEESYTKGVTVDDMLSHRTGLPRHDMSYFGPNAKKPDSAKSVTRNLRNLDVAGPIRMEYRYCNIMYTVASYLIESLTRNSFTNFLEKSIFAPLGMNSTSLQPSSARKKGLADRFAVGYEWDEDTKKYNSVEMPEGPESQGAGFIVTSANDFAKWVRALMNQKGPISPDLYKSLVRQRTIVSPDADELLPFTSPEIYSVGLSTVYYRGHAIVSHDGNDAGYGSFHFWLPAFKFGGVVLGNSGSVFDTASILVNELIDEVLNVPRDQRIDWEKVITERREKSDGPDEDPIAEIRKEFNPELKENQPQTRPLKDYVGVYHNKGYGDVEFQIKDDRLFVDATDRAYNFYLNLTHICDQTKYAAHVIGGKATGSEDGGYIKAEFEFKDGKAAQVGLDFEADLGNNIVFKKK